ncbi:MAG: hypothetical protein ACRDRL_06000 [Sciscionella sp.]
MVDHWLVPGTAAGFGALLVLLVIRTVLAERSAGTGTESSTPFVAGAGIRRLDLVCATLAVLTAIAAIARVILGTLG